MYTYIHTHRDTDKSKGDGQNIMTIYLLAKVKTSVMDTLLENSTLPKVKKLKPKHP